jgi:hypothetical protein
MSVSPTLCRLGGLLLLTAWPGLALATPWTLPRGKAAIVGGFSFSWADEEFFESGPKRRFPLNGAYRAASFTLSGRTGFTDRLELEASVPLSVVSYTSDPVILLPRPAGSEGDELDYYQQNIINLGRTVAGVGDFTIAGRYRWTLSPIAVATEIRVKAPSGYPRPAGTFGERPASAEQFLAEVGRFARPGNVEDDVTLGDGQLDLSALIHAGFTLPSRTFVRGAIGYELRLGGAGDRVIGELRAGQQLGPSVLVFGGARLARTVQSGAVIGVSVAAIDPTLPAEDYRGAENLLLRELRLERDSLDVGGGFIFRLTPDVELNLAYEQVIWGRNTAASRSVSIGLALRTDLDAPLAKR